MAGDDKAISRAERIKQAAKELFLDKGFDGTTMQAIADASKVNKALLNYYFEGKEKLFLLIFREELTELSRGMAKLWVDEASSLGDRLEAWIDSQKELITRSPRLPLFIIAETARNPALIQELLAEFLPPQAVLSSLSKAGDAGGAGGAGGGARLKLLTELISAVSALVFFPAIAAPLIRPLAGNDGDYELALFEAQVRLAKELVRQRLAAAGA
jgi:AcrR family transcriptional regulator